MTHDEMVRELARCATDIWYWLTTYVYVSSPSEGTIRFAPWPHLRQLLTIILTHDRIIVLKARQIGVSWLLAAISLHTALFIPNATALMFSRREVESTAMKERAKFIWRYLPDWMRQPFGKDNDELLTFPSMESKIQSFPATEGAGRGETATIAIIDEWADIEHDRGLYTAVLPTVEHGKLIGVSTAKGKNNLFAEIYWGAKRGENSFVPVFIPYNVIAGRTPEWWALQKRDMPGYLAMQEYPLLEADAFLVSGTCMFDIDALRAMPLLDMPPIIDAPEIYIPPAAGHHYIAGVDTALGIAGGDFSVCQILDESSNDQVAKFRSRLPIEEYTTVAHALLNTYDQPKIIVEEQPQGRLMVNQLMRRGSANTPYPAHKIYHRAKNIPCWHTTEPNRKNILAELEQAIRTSTLKIHSKATVEECLSFGYNEAKRKFEGLTGHDDEVISLALTWHYKCALPPAPAADGFKPVSYIGGDAIEWSEINWQKADPFDNLTTVGCETCQGERWVLLPSGLHEICDDCGGVGVRLRRKHV